ncbi:MAG: alpha/beta fold hydrolase, partial [Pseudonocardiaceae bacterium]
MPCPLRPTAVLAVVLALSGCTAGAGTRQAVSGEGSGLGADVSQYQAGPAGTVPPGLERFYAQRLTWSGCKDFATTDFDRKTFADPTLRCSRVEVPLDYAHPQGRTAWIGVLSRPADNHQERLGSVLVNPGGPGASGMTAVASRAGAVAGTDLGRRFDLVGFDPRGIGASQPKIVCRNTQEEDAKRLDLDLDTSPPGVAKTESENRAYAQLCAQRVGKDLLANAGTRDVARDMDVLRSALGDAKLNFLGYSYGTRLGT